MLKDNALTYTIVPMFMSVALDRLLLYTVYSGRAFEYIVFFGPIRKKLNRSIHLNNHQSIHGFWSVSSSSVHYHPIHSIWSLTISDKKRKNHYRDASFYLISLNGANSDYSLCFQETQLVLAA